jgi:hypothetical protein
MDLIPVPQADLECLLAAYIVKLYLADGHCTLCGNRGIVDTRGVTTPAGVPVGRLNYCLCLNGVALRSEQADMHWHLTAS